MTMKIYWKIMRRQFVWLLSTFSTHPVSDRREYKSHNCDDEDLLEDYAETVCVVIFVPLPRTRYQIEESIIATIVTMKIY